MRVQKITFLICFIIAIISGIGVLSFEKNGLLQNVFLGIFTGFIASAVIAVIEYFYEYAKIIEKMKANILAVYLNLSVISKTLGKVLPTIYTATYVAVCKNRRRGITT